MRQPLPQTGTDWPELKGRMADYATGDVRWRDGKTAVYVFNAGPEVERVQKEAYALFMSENGLGPMAFPSLKRMEEEVVGFGLFLLHGPDDASGAITSGGTDSITMAMKAARDYARKARGVAGPLNIVTLVIASGVVTSSSTTPAACRSPRPSRNVSPPPRSTCASTICAPPRRGPGSRRRPTATR